MVLKGPHKRIHDTLDWTTKLADRALHGSALRHGKVSPSDLREQTIGEISGPMNPWPPGGSD